MVQMVPNRTWVKINDKFSDYREVKYGSVQESVLGPKFFNIYVRSQPQVFEKMAWKHQRLQMIRREVKLSKSNSNITF